MSWRESLVRIADHEVESLRKRLTEVLDRKAASERKLDALAAHVRAELARADVDPEVAWMRPAFLKGAEVRRQAIQAEISAISFEEAGARDALAQAFEQLKKFEFVAEREKAAVQRRRDEIEAKAMDELGLRKRPG